VKLTFAHGAEIPDPAGLLQCESGRQSAEAIDIHEGENVNAKAFKALAKAAVAFNSGNGHSRN
jgi:hypothetical protein